jgi:hypothetical protein
VKSRLGQIAGQFRNVWHFWSRVHEI